VAQVSEVTKKWAEYNQHQRAGYLIKAASTQLNKFSVPWPDFTWQDQKVEGERPDPAGNRSEH
jgi:hypothetical protein